MDRHCRFVAKLGVNLVRLHTTIAATKEGSAITDVNEEEINGVFRFLKAAKENGIYVLISPYYAHHDTPKSWGIEGYDQGQKPWGLIFFNPKMQEGYKAWTKALYTRKNPHTGLAIKDDPTVAVIQIQNEDSLLFWTFQAIAKPQLELFAQQFAGWLKKQYGSLDKAMAAWEGAQWQGDDAAGGKVGLVDSYQLTIDQQGGMAKRVRDQLRFMAETQRAFYADMGKYVRKELGCKQILNATNWRTANDARLKDVERWTYAALEVDAENEYYGADYQHVGEHNGYRIDPGHFIVNESCLTKPLELTANFRQHVGHPFIVTETSWKHPNLYQSEGPFLISAYQSLNGLDAVVWFSATDAEWALDPRFQWAEINGIKPMFKWSCSVPMMMGMFPANALLFRNNYVKPGETVVHEQRTVNDVLDRKLAVIDDNELYGVPGPADPELQSPKLPDGRASRAAFLVGRVETVLEGDPKKTKVADFSANLDSAKRTIRSSTGQLVWNWGDGVCTMNAPQAQGVAGFLKKAGGTFETDNVTVTSDNHYATVQVVSMDAKPISASKKVLVQVGTTSRLTNWESKPTEFDFEKQKVKGEVIVNTGVPPWRVENTRVRLTLKKTNLKKATLLDHAGYAAGDVPVKREGGAISIELPPNAMYVVLQ
jgi:hypothetical protein